MILLRNPVHLYNKYKKLCDRSRSVLYGQMEYAIAMCGSPGFESRPAGYDFSFSFFVFFFLGRNFYSNSGILIDSTISVSVFCFAHDHFVFLVPPS